MRSISRKQLDGYLRLNGTYDDFYKEVRSMCWVFPYIAKGHLIYQDSLALTIINKYFLIQVEIKFEHAERFWKYDLIQELTLDEFADSLINEKEFKEAYEELLKYLR